MIPSVTVLELRGGAYDQVALVQRDGVLDVLLPYPLTLVPSQLLA